jgi:hypothetical protein
MNATIFGRGFEVSAEIEQEKEGRWVAKLPGVPELSVYGATRHEAAVRLTVSGLHLLAERIRSHAGETDSDEPSEIVGATAARDSIVAVLREMLAEVSGLIPNADPPESFLAGWADYRAGRVVDLDRALEEEPPPVV